MAVSVTGPMGEGNVMQSLVRLTASPIMQASRFQAKSNDHAKSNDLPVSE